MASTVLGSENSLWLKEERIKDAIVKIDTVFSKPDYFRPWNTYTNQRVGSGCIIKGKRILTNAHVVADKTFVEVRRYGQARRYRAEVLNISHDADLALLTVKDTAFFSGVTPLEFTELPRMQQEVLVFGFPIGGDNLSVTKGVISRIEHRYYAHSSEYLLAAQIDAAINPGNSGGPVLADNRIVGVVMQMYKGGDNIGYTVPVPVIKHFFSDIVDGRYDGFPSLGLVLKDMESPDLKREYGVSENQTGVFVRHIFPGSPAKGHILKKDVIMAVDGHAIADDGTVEFRQKERTAFTYYVDMHQVGEKIHVDVLRNSERKKVTFVLTKKKGDFRLVPTEQYDQLPRYFIYGGVVFTQLTKDLLKSWGKYWQTKAPQNLLTEMSNWPTETKKEIVVVLRVLASDVNKGYHNLSNWIIEEVNGGEYIDFNDFYHRVTSSKEPFVVLKDKKEFQIVLDRKKAEESHAGILKTYRIKSDRSRDLKEAARK
ncbi:MAG: trypsin-like peptidase domain-containing protein [Deltaproteobacteria bacterium]|nr:trypsin-like peptidase domain-containing protein [Deltaproteobacteria bacterium]